MLEERDLHARQSESITKYTYYLVAAALAAVALTVHVTKDERLSWVHLGFGLAVVAWITSALCGLRLLSDRSLIDRLSIESHMVRRGASVAIPQEDADEADEIIIGRVKLLNERNRRRDRWQWRLLLAGGVCFCASHIAHMAAL